MRIPLHPCFILHTRPYRETSLLVEVFSRDHGRATLVARGARRQKNKSRPHYQPLQPLQVSWSARGELGTLGAVEPAGPVMEYSRTALLAAFYLNELIMRLLHRHEAHPDLYDAYARALTGLSSTPGHEATLRVFEKKLLESIGYGLILTHVPATRAPVLAASNYQYLPGRGPVEGERVGESGLPVSGRTLLALACEQLDDSCSLQEAKSLMRFLLAPHLDGKPLASRELFQSFLDLTGC